MFGKKLYTLLLFTSIKYMFFSVLCAGAGGLNPTLEKSVVQNVSTGIRTWIPPGKCLNLGKLQFSFK